MVCRGQSSHFFLKLKLKKQISTMYFTYKCELHIYNIHTIYEADMYILIYICFPYQLDVTLVMLLNIFYIVIIIGFTSYSCFEYGMNIIYRYLKYYTHCIHSINLVIVNRIAFFSLSLSLTHTHTHTHTHLSHFQFTQ